MNVHSFMKIHSFYFMTSNWCHSYICLFVRIGNFETSFNSLYYMMMESDNLEFFKLDEIDRKVLLWLMGHAPQKSVFAWVDYIADAYKREKSIHLNVERLSVEIHEAEVLQ